jgi:hypothetical protein
MPRKRERLAIPQQRLALSYGALRNALGNYGRLGTDVMLLTPAPTFSRWGLEIQGLPADAKRVILFDRGGRELKRADTSGPGTLRVPLGVPPVGPVAWVEVYGRKNRPIRLGIPIS